MKFWSEMTQEEQAKILLEAGIRGQERQIAEMKKIKESSDFIKKNFGNAIRDLSNS